MMYDMAPDVQLQYFQKAYVSRVGSDGAFEVTITEPVTVPTAGTLKLVACCENGTIAGDGAGRGLESAHEINYRTSRTGYRTVTAVHGASSNGATSFTGTADGLPRRGR